MMYKEEGGSFEILDYIGIVYFFVDRGFRGIFNERVLVFMENQALY